MSEYAGASVAAGHSIAECLREAAEALRGSGVDEARASAEILLAHALACSRIDLYAHPDQPIDATVAERFRRSVRRRAAREPIQHVTGRTEFWSLEIACDARALIPRPETELAVQATLDRLEGRPRARVADIGTGSGCIAIALAHERRDARIVASDISSDALALAAENVRTHGCEDRITLIQGDLAAPFLDRGLGGTFDVVVSNPPYVAADEIRTLAPEVSEHDPRVALDGGPDGLVIVRRLLDEAPLLLRPAGCLVIELGEHQAGAVRDAAEAAGWCGMDSVMDGAGVERVFVARRGTDG